MGESANDFDNAIQKNSFKLKFYLTNTLIQPLNLSTKFIQLAFINYFIFVKIKAQKNSASYQKDIHIFYDTKTSQIPDV